MKFGICGLRVLLENLALVNTVTNPRVL